MRVRQLCGLMVSLLWLAGCSGNEAEVSGTVRLDGELIQEGSINFIPVEGTKGPGVGAVIKDGKYHILEVVPKEKTIFPPACKFAAA